MCSVIHTVIDCHDWRVENGRRLSIADVSRRKQCRDINRWVMLARCAWSRHERICTLESPINRYHRRLPQSYMVNEGILRAWRMSDGVGGAAEIRKKKKKCNLGTVHVRADHQPTTTLPSKIFVCDGLPGQQMSRHGVVPRLSRRYSFNSECCCVTGDNPRVQTKDRESRCFTPDAYPQTVAPDDDQDARQKER